MSEDLEAVYERFMHHACLSDALEDANVETVTAVKARLQPVLGDGWQAHDGSPFSMQTNAQRKALLGLTQESKL